MIEFDTAVAVQLLYGRQSHAIDSGRAHDWAATFTEDGVFDSPSYPDPVIGTAALARFARGFFDDAVAASEKRRHVVTDVAVEPVADGEVAVDCYLQIVATPRGGESRVVRFTTVHDRVVRVDGHWRIAHRRVARDDT
ncbi:nuclear transport factor 2 family protein [Rhodococcoides yunnanense]|uniref:nuclear transport factor 2 family protein n=1 Tax=Rhodococcoides yunnanense TaxID=278209 RepID=UPI0009334360|nr:nuclear transport factor 2 family protein [Rhodococcus yunnanensis]